MEIPVYQIKGVPVQVPPDLPRLKALYEKSYKNSGTPLIVDNGSCTCRAGWGGMDSPVLTFRNIVARQKNQKDLQEVLVGSEIPESDIFKLNIKSPYERDVIQHIHTQEHIFDYMFENLGIHDQSVNHPVLLTETVCAPNYSRNMLLELLFECYQVPSLNFGIDALFAFQQERGADSSGMILKIGHQTTHWIPYLRGEFLPHYARRVNIGGQTCTQTLLKYMQAHYFYNRNLITPSLAQEIIYSYCYTALDYRIELEKLRVSNQLRIQLPWVMTQQPTQEELKKKQLKRKEQGKRLREISAKKSEENKRLAAMDLQELEGLAKLYRKNPVRFQEGLIAQGLNNYEELKKKIKVLKTRLNIDVEENEKFNLIDVPDEELNPEQIKKKRMQKIHKSSQEAREQRKLKEQEEKERIEKLKAENPDAYLEDMHRRREEIVKRIEGRAKLKKELNNRHSRGAQRRLRCIADLSADKIDDNFGMNDQDWDAYRFIQKDTAEEEEEDQALLAEIDAKIAKLDSNHLINIGEVARPATAEDYQILLNVDRIRPPEIFFQPSIIGLEQAGVPLVMEQILSLFPEATARELASCVYIYGGPSFFPGFAERIQREVRMIRPADSLFEVVRCPELQMAWKGASYFSITEKFRNTAFTKAEYEEQGALRLEHQHQASNVYYETPERTEHPYKKTKAR